MCDSSEPERFLDTNVFSISFWIHSLVNNFWCESSDDDDESEAELDLQEEDLLLFCWGMTLWFSWIEGKAVEEVEECLPSAPLHPMSESHNRFIY